MKSIHFITPTRMSLMDISTMGDSEKLSDPNKIGQFCTGFKHSVALLLRNNVDMTISVYGETEDRGDWEEPLTTHYTFGTYTQSDHKREKELIDITVETEFHGGSPNSAHDMREPRAPESYKHKTGFSKHLGHNWLLWMSLREIYSNMLDEGGYYSEENEEVEEGTVITLSFKEDSDFADVWENRHIYINESEPLFKIANGFEVLENVEGYLRIYKQNILVYTDEKIPSRWAYNIKGGEIDERRILSNVYSVESSIANAIMGSKNEEFLRQIILPKTDFREDEFLTDMSTYYSASELMHNIATEVYQEFGGVDSYSWLISAIKKRPDCKIGGKILTTIEDSLWGYSSKVTVESKPMEYPLTPDEVFSPIQTEINKFFNFDLDVDIKRASLSGSKVVADKYEKCLILDENFSVENDMSELIVEYISLKKEGNVVKNLSLYICDLIRK